MARVALFSTHFLEYSQTFVHAEVTALSRYDVEVFCKRRMHADLFPLDAVHVANPLYSMTRADRHFDELFEQKRYDLVHAHFGTGAIYAMRFAKRFRLPLVVTFHGYDVPLLGSVERFHPKYWRYAVLGPKLLKTLTLGLCASTELLELLADMRVPRERLRLHHIGIDLTRFNGEPRPPSEPLQVIMIGRFVEKKGFVYGLSAFARVASERNLRLTLIGGGELESELERKAGELGIADRVDFTGVLQSPEIARRLRQSDVLLAPSVVTRFGNRESGLLTVKEASASGVVPIATLHGGIPEIVEDGVTGFLVPERDVDALADRLRRLVDDAELRRRMAVAGRKRMEQMYDVRHRVAALERSYDEARELHRGSG